jgi:hypothetical protein
MWDMSCIHEIIFQKMVMFLALKRIWFLFIVIYNSSWRNPTICRTAIIAYIKGTK